MNRLASALGCWISACAAYAQTNPNEAPPPETINVTAIVLFVIVFFGLCGYYGWSVWRKEKQRAQKEREEASSKS